MAIQSAKVISASSAIPRGFSLVGWIEKHPNGIDGSMTVLKSSAGIEVAWDGMAIKSLPRRWREKTAFEEIAK